MIIDQKSNTIPKKHIPLNVALFENRHAWPSYVTEYIYEDRKGGYDARDFEIFEGIATLKLLKWKSEGVEVINLYLSGLIGATIAVLNAAYSIGIYVKLFHYSANTNNWIPQLCDFLPIPSGIILNESEIHALEEEEKTKKELSERERKTIVSYVNLFNLLYHKYDPDRFTWEDVYSYITREYTNIVIDYIMLMKPYFEKNKLELEEPFNDVIRKRIESDRGQRKPIPIYKPSNKRFYRPRRNIFYSK